MSDDEKDPPKLADVLAFPLTMQEGTVFFIDHEPGDFVFNGKDGQQLLRLCSNGDIYVGERFAENDKEVVEQLRLFLAHVGIR